MKKLIKTVIIAATLVMFTGTIVVQAHPANCQNGCTMNGSGCYMQECSKTCIKQGCDNARCQNSKYCKNHKIKRVEPKKNTWEHKGHHGHHGK